MTFVQMTHSRSVLATVASLLVLGGACSTSSSVPISQINARYASAFCSYYARCPLVGGAKLVGILAGHPGTAGSCEDLVGDSDPANFAAIEAAVVAGTIRYDGDAAERCLSALGGQCIPFDALFAVEASCRSVYAGAVSDGGTCTLDDQCMGSARCAKLGGSCSGTCVATLGVGAACSSSNECSDDLGGVMDCDSTIQNPTDHCVITRWSTAAPGAACGDLDVDGDERSSAYCTGGTYCKLSAGLQTGNCTYPIAAGATCAPNQDACAGDAMCTGVAGPPTCHAVTVVNQVNAGCNDAALIMCNPLDRLICRSLVCEVIGDGTVGAECRGDFASDCNDGFYCSNGTGGAIDTCQAKLTNGTPCSDDGDSSCASGYCDYLAPLTPSCAPEPCSN